MQPISIRSESPHDFTNNAQKKELQNYLFKTFLNTGRDRR